MVNAYRLTLGAMLTLPGIVLYFISGWEGIGPSLFFSVLFTFGARWGLLGLLGFVKPVPPRMVTYGVATALAVVMALAGPSVSNSYHRGNEPKAWLKVADVPETDVWRVEYLNAVPEPFRRPEWASRYAEMRCQEALEKADYKTMREVAAEVFGANSKDYDDKVRESVQKAYQELFTKGLAAIKPTKLADSEMTAAFRKSLEAIASNPTRKILLHFEAKGGVGPIPSDKAYMSDLKPEYAKLPILPVGEAFGPKSESRRASNTRQAIQDSLDAVIPPDLAAVELATDKGDPQDVHFWINAEIKRLEGFYVNSSNNVPDAFLYKVEVYWKFRILVDGKPLGEFSFRSEPAKSVSYSTDPGDPEWAPYSIMMDSASDNFARLVVGSLGLEPPPEKTQYTFTPNDAPPAAQPATPAAAASPSPATE